MKLSQLLSIYPQLKWGENPAGEVHQVCFDSRKVQPGDVFVAVRGGTVDSHEFLPQVCKAGAIGLVVESEVNIPKDFLGAVVVVPDSREALDKLACRIYNSPANNLFCVGITGTNGKTSVSYMVEAILSEFGWKVGVLGTIDHHLEGHVWESALTTPDPLTLQKRLWEFEALGARAATFEVSSHALTQSRADHIPFDVVVFTNLTRDHLDYHGSMENYFLAKERLFLEIPPRHPEKRTTAVINIDDEHGSKIRLSSGVRPWRYGASGGDFSYKILSQDFSGCSVQVLTPRGETEFKLPLTGKHNVENAMAAIGVGMAAGASLDICCKALESFRGVPGRLEPVPHEKNFHVFVDYAHTDDALRTVLESLNQIRIQLGLTVKIISVFGCGGDRDPGKRPMMAKAAMEGSDVVFVTSDNPRTEDPKKIIDDCMSVVPHERVDKSVFVEEDRRTALFRAFKVAQKGDVVLIAGKGHEAYQIIGTERLPFSDMEVARELLK